MKGYALVKVTKEDVKKIIELLNKMNKEQKDVFDYFKAKKAAGHYNVKRGLFFKRDCFSGSKAYEDLIKSATYDSELLELSAKMMLFHGIFSIRETDHGEALKKIGHLSLEDQIYLDDELCRTWNKFIRSE